MKRIITNFNDDWAGLTALVGARWVKKPTPFVVTLHAAPKTFEQLGYLHSEVLPKLTQALFDAGDISKNSERYGKYWLKEAINYGEWIEFRGGKVFDDDSFEKASTEVLSDAIDTAINESVKRGVYIQPPKFRGRNTARKRSRLESEGSGKRGGEIERERARVLIVHALDNIGESMITITLEGAITAKARARKGKSSWYTPPKTEAYSNKLAWEAKKAMAGRPLLKGALWMYFEAYMPIPKYQAKKIKEGDWHIIKPDLDNIEKQICDSLNGIVYKDDCQIALTGQSEKTYSNNPRLVIYIKELERP